MTVEKSGMSNHRTLNQIFLWLPSTLNVVYIWKKITWQAKHWWTDQYLDKFQVIFHIVSMHCSDCKCTKTNVKVDFQQTSEFDILKDYQATRFIYKQKLLLFMLFKNVKHSTPSTFGA